MITHFLIFPLFVWGAIIIGSALIGGGAVAIFSGDKRQLGILGMEYSGKTYFLNILRNKRSVGGTGREDYESFKFRLASGNEITIKKGYDMGGAKDYMNYYKEVVNTSDVLFYFFDINKYFNDLTYQRDCNSRFFFIDGERFNPNTKVKKDIVVVATHRDKCLLSDSEINKKFTSVVGNKTYKEMVKNIVFINLTDNKATTEFINKVFK